VQFENVVDPIPNTRGTPLQVSFSEPDLALMQDHLNSVMTARQHFGTFVEQARVRGIRRKCESVLVNFRENAVVVFTFQERWNRRGWE
jgi:hypothetical protein